MSRDIVGLFKHEWTVSVGDWTFGVEELQDYVLRAIPGAPTTVYVGPTSFETNWSAYQVLGISAIGAVLLAAVTAFVITKVRSGKTA